MLESPELISSRSEELDSILDIKLKNFGPISEGRISLKPLTILIGPNNSGKSYVAALVYSIIKSTYYMHNAMPGNLARQAIKECVTAHKRGERGLTLSANLVSNINKVIHKQTTTRLEQNLKNNFGTNLANLILIGRDKASIEANAAGVSATILLTKSNQKFTVQDHISSVRVNLGYQDHLSAACNKKNVIIDNLDISDDDRLTSFVVLLHSIHSIGRLQQSIYFPTERAGLLKSYKILSAAMMEYVLHEDTKRRNQPLSALAVDFLKILVCMEKDRGSYAGIAHDLEHEIMHGNVEIESKKDVPEIKYQNKELEIPINAMSSSILELAPITLCLKHIVQPSNLLIIEEPESNLDLEKQRILAKFLVRMIRKRLKVIITTHSPFMLEQLSNFLQAGGISESERVDEFGYEKDDYLGIGEVVAYSFEPQPDSSYKIQPIETSQNGISQEYFIKTQDSMYEESYELEKKMLTD